MPMIYSYLFVTKLRAFLERKKTSPKELKEVVFFIYSIDIRIF